MTTRAKVRVISRKRKRNDQPNHASKRRKAPKPIVIDVEEDEVVEVQQPNPINEKRVRISLGENKNEIRAPEPEQTPLASVPRRNRRRRSNREQNKKRDTRSTSRNTNNNNRRRGRKTSTRKKTKLTDALINRRVLRIAGDDGTQQGAEQMIADNPKRQRSLKFQKKLKERELRNLKDETDLELLNTGKYVTDKNQYIEKKMSEILRPHQIEGLRFCWNRTIVPRDDSQKGAILAHVMGLGKTLTMICYIILCRKYTRFRRVMVFSPKTVLVKWEDEVNMWCKRFGTKPKIPMYVFDEVLNTYKKRWEAVERWQKYGGILLINYEIFVILTGHHANTSVKLLDYLRDFRNAFKETEVLILDEGHRLKNAETMVYKAMMEIFVKTRNRIILTGTPMQNDLGEYYQTVSFIRPDLFGKQEWEKLFTNPIKAGQGKDATQQDFDRMNERCFLLREQMKQFVHRKDERVLEEDLPPKTDIVLYVKLSDFQKELYNSYLEDVAAYRDNKRFIIVIVQNLAKCINHPDLWRLYLEKEGIIKLHDTSIPRHEQNFIDLSSTDEDFLDEDEDSDSDDEEEIVKKKKKKDPSSNRIRIAKKIAKEGQRLSERIVVGQNRTLPPPKQKTKQMKIKKMKKTSIFNISDSDDDDDEEDIKSSSSLTIDNIDGPLTFEDHLKVDLDKDDELDDLLNFDFFNTPTTPVDPLSTTTTTTTTSSTTTTKKENDPETPTKKSVNFDITPLKNNKVINMTSISIDDSDDEEEEEEVVVRKKKKKKRKKKKKKRKKKPSSQLKERKVAKKKTREKNNNKIQSALPSGPPNNNNQLPGEGILGDKVVNENLINSNFETQVLSDQLVSDSSIDRIFRANSGVGNKQDYEIIDPMGIQKFGCFQKVLDKKYDVFSNSPEISSKFFLTMRLIENFYQIGEKCIIFSQYTKVLDTMENMFKFHAINISTDPNTKDMKCLVKGEDFFRIDGSVKCIERQERIDEFNDPRSMQQVFLISILAGSYGIDLPGATRVIIMEQHWNPTIISQAVARAWRIGQKRKVFVYRLVAASTSEEAILKRAISKEWTSKKIVDGLDIKRHIKREDIEGSLNYTLKSDLVSLNLLMNTIEGNNTMFENDPVLLNLFNNFGNEWLYDIKLYDKFYEEDENEKITENNKNSATRWFESWQKERGSMDPEMREEMFRNSVIGGNNNNPFGSMIGGGVGEERLTEEEEEDLRTYQIENEVQLMGGTGTGQGPPALFPPPPIAPNEQVIDIEDEEIEGEGENDDDEVQIVRNKTPKRKKKIRKKKDNTIQSPPFIPRTLPNQPSVMPQPRIQPRRQVRNLPNYTDDPVMNDNIRRFRERVANQGANFLKEQMARWGVHLAQVRAGNAQIRAGNGR